MPVAVRGWGRRVRVLSYPAVIMTGRAKTLGSATTPSKDTALTLTLGPYGKASTGGRIIKELAKGLITPRE